MSQMAVSRSASHMKVGVNLPDIQHPLSRMSHPDNMDIRGVSRAGDRTPESATGRPLACETPVHPGRKSMSAMGRENRTKKEGTAFRASISVDAIPEGVEVKYGDPAATRLPVFDYNLREDARAVMSRRSELLGAYLREQGLSVRVREVDCRKVLHGHSQEVDKANALERQQVPIPTDVHIGQLAGNCSGFRQHYGFLMDPLTRMEENFPIAFTVLAYKQASQVVDLLRAIYRPQNWYCLHADQKSSVHFRQAMEAVSNCFPNVFMASRAVKVYWGKFSVLEPEIVCLQDLWTKGQWEYVINLSGQEFPLRTNYELVRILKAYKGANDVEAFVPDYRTVHYRWQSFLPAPHNISLYKGGVQVVLSRGFVDYVLHSPTARDFLRWCQNTKHPDEHFFNSLNHNPHLRVPGGGTGQRLSKGSRAISLTVARLKVWKPGYCPGRKYVCHVCILNVRALPWLRTRLELFANKFYADYSRLALRCLAEDLHNRTREQALGRMGFDVLPYQRQTFVRNRLPG